jgi:uncharacterized 2Fe-2S/4Fe-4S cluster protein (DUF4445 family)
VRIDRVTLEPRFRVIGSSRWSDETGFAASTRRTGRHRHLRLGIVEVLGRALPRGVITADGTIDGRLGRALTARRPRRPDLRLLLNEGGPARSGRGRGRARVARLSITQNDVRAIQLAKAALYAGRELLMDHLGVESVDRVKLAGAFGQPDRPALRAVLGLVPDAPLDRSPRRATPRAPGA